MNRQDLTWAPLIPLIGGFPLGAELAFNKPPEYIGSLDGFKANDQHYINYQNNILGRNLNYNIFNQEESAKRDKVNIVVATPPLTSIAA